ncbi:GDSL-type esterase/lipase family protein [Phenylobacterium sp.]|uniref:GDSL-type esterase/lipase family protein n=1 Tax=Phenylobacterium sp. TaxID=1871053 RepID=UPI002E2F549C|nr:GDSL-type esterase/lipase family protein [Phenylobacterium sp.]HEX2560112.1 GDSL-type esterase/lipase family protein [Phenylobacterium sp.]
MSDADPARFADQMAAFAEEDRLALRPACQIVFTGSSSIRFWKTLGQDLAPLPVLNRGFGGSRIADVNDWFEQVVGRYRPAAVVFYAGENDLAAGKDPAAVVADFERFLALKDKALGDTPVYFITLKPSKLRWDHFAAQSWINDRIRELSARRADLEFIDVVQPMLEAGRPKDIFVEDNLHMTARGYVIWTSVVKPVLQRDAERLAAACKARG